MEYLKCCAKKEGDKVAVKEPPIKLNLGDSNGIKRVLDEGVQKILVDELKYEEDNYVDNWKMFFGIVSILFGLVAQFTPERVGGAFPANRLLLGVCCAGYFVLSGVLQYMLSYVEKDYILFTTKACPLGRPCSVGSQFPRYQHVYTLRFEPKDLEPIAYSKGCNEFFDDEGRLHEEKLKEWVFDVSKKCANAVKTKKAQ